MRLNYDSEYIIDMSNNLDDFRALEKLHYEVVTRERLLGIAIDEHFVSDENIKAFYEEYKTLYSQYDKMKSRLNKKYIREHVKGALNYWEADFENDCFKLYEQY